MGLQITISGSQRCQLRAYSHYSRGDSFFTINRLVIDAKNRSLGTLALTDRGTVRGFPEFDRTCKNTGIRPLFGCEMELIANSRSVPKSRNTSLFPLTLLVQNDDGYRNLLRMIAKAKPVSANRRMAIHESTLHSHSKGLIALVGFDIPPSLKHQHEHIESSFTDFECVLARMKDHSDLLVLFDFRRTQSIAVRVRLTDVCTKLGVRHVDSHFSPLINPDDQNTIRSYRRLLHKHGLWDNPPLSHEIFASGKEECSRFEVDPPSGDDSVASATEITKMIEFDWLRFYDMEHNRSQAKRRIADEKLRALCNERLIDRYDSTGLWDMAVERLQVELQYFAEVGYSEFLVTLAEGNAGLQANNVPFTMDSPWSESLACYLLGISALCPLENRLSYGRLQPDLSFKDKAIKLYMSRANFHEAESSLSKPSNGMKLVRGLAEATCSIHRLQQNATSMLKIPISRYSELRRVFVERGRSYNPTGSSADLELGNQSQASETCEKHAEKQVTSLFLLEDCFWSVDDRFSDSDFHGCRDSFTFSVRVRS